MGIKPQVVKAAIAAMRPEVSCDFVESVRSPQRVRPLADKIDIAVFYFTEATCGQGGSAAPLRAVGCSLRAGSSALEAEPEARAMLIQLGFADIFKIEVRAGLALLLDPPRWAATLSRPASRAREMQRNPHAACCRSGQSATPPN